MYNFFTENPEVNGLFTLTGNDFNHAKNVLRLKVGERFLVSHDKKSNLCELFCYEGESVIAKIIERDYQDTSLPIEIYLFQGLPKADKLELIIQKTVELGVHTIIPVEMKHSIVKIEENKQKKKIERWQKICKDASEQSKRLEIPQVNKICKLADLESLKGVKLTCSTIEKSQNLKNYLKNLGNYDRINLVIGPEGGLSKEEEEYLKKIGFVSVSLGNRIMRVETVPIFLLSVFNYESME